MKQRILSLLTLSAAFAVAGFAADQPAITVPNTAAKQPKLLRVATINGAQAVREFQAKVQALQAERQSAVDLDAAVAKETDAKKKQELKTQLDAIVAKLNEDNAAMQKTYGFSLTRNYVMEIESANIYVQVTDEEAAKIEQAEKDKAKK